MFTLHYLTVAKLIVCIDESLKAVLKESFRNRKLSKVVSEALEFYISTD